MPLNPYFSSEIQTQGSYNEQLLLEDLVEESIKINGQEFYYIPRVLIAKDEILGEDRLSKFKDAYPIEMYIETPQGFLGQGSFVSKFGLYIEQSLQVTMSKRRWGELIARCGGTTILQERPAEGDLVYYPITKRLFEIKYVDKQPTFWQLGNIPTYKLTIELFQYSSERLDTGITAIDEFETLKSFDTSKLSNTSDVNGNAGIDSPENFGDNKKFVQQANSIIVGGTTSDISFVGSMQENSNLAAQETAANQTARLLSESASTNSSETTND